MTARVDQGQGAGQGPAEVGSVHVGSARPASRLGLEVLVLAAAAVLTLGALIGLTALVARPGAAPVPTATAPTYLVDPVRTAPPIHLIGSDGRPFTLDSMRGRIALVFFGYTHCPDVCPATIGFVGQVMDRIGADVGSVFVSIDPERDTVPWLADYVRYLPEGFVTLTGSPADVRGTADAWGVRYAKVDGGEPDSYSMSHTASVYVVDQQGMLRAEFPFGTQPADMIEVVRGILATPAASARPVSLPQTASATVAPPSAAPTVAPSIAPTVGPTSTTPVASVRVEVVSTSVWAGGSSPVILALYDSDRRLDDLGAQVRVQVTRTDGSVVGSAVDAVAVQPHGVAEVSFVATVDIPTGGWWRLAVTVLRGGLRSAGTATVGALDPGVTAPLGKAAPTARTPILDDVGGFALELTTDPAPDLRLYQTSSVDALAARRPFVLVVDSPRFKTSPACGKALVMARYLLDRWAAVPFIHLEPFEYDVVTSTPTLVGTLFHPTLVPAAEAWGLGSDPWSATSMPWILIVDGNGIVRAKYQGIIGTADVDVILSLVADGG